MLTPVLGHATESLGCDAAGLNFRFCVDYTAILEDLEVQKMNGFLSMGMTP